MAVPVYAGPGPCTPDGPGTTVTCSGGHSAGIQDGVDFFAPPVHTLIISGVTADVVGVYIDTGGASEPLAVDVDSGLFGIRTTVDNQFAIYAITNGADSNLQLKTRGTVSTTGAGANGVYTYTFGDRSLLAVDNGAAITTAQDTATGLFAFTRGADASLALANSGAITTHGTNAFAIFAQVDGDGSDLALSNSAMITTDGEGSYGIYAIGTGTDNVIAFENTAAITTHGMNSDAINSYTLRANSPVNLTNSGALETKDDGTGLNIFTNGAASAINFTNSGTISTNGYGAEGIQVVTRGTGSSLMGSNTGDITSSGQFSHGIVVQTQGADSPLNFINSGNIATSGLADGVIAVTTGSNSPLSLTSSGDIILSGSDAVHAILARSDLSDITVALGGGHIVGGTGSGVYLFRGATNILNIAQPVVVEAISGSAIGADSGNDTVNNSGLVRGNVTLDVGLNAFNNLEAGRLESGSNVQLGTANPLTNEGVLSPGGAGTIQTTTLTGNLVQTGTGSFVVDVNPLAGTADRLDVTGTASLAGTVVVNLLNAGPTPGFQEITILHADAGITNNGISIVNTGAISYSLLFPNPNDLALTLGVLVDLAPDGLNQNQTALGENINSIQAAGGSPAFQTAVSALAALPNVAALADAYDTLSPELYLKTEIAALFSSLNFADNLMSCRVRDGGFAFIREGQCVWAQASGRYLDQDRTAATTGFGEDAWRFSAGAQFTIGSGTHLNFAAGFEKSFIDTRAASADANRALAGFAIKHQLGPLMLSAAVTGGYGWHDNRRNLAFPGFAGVATGEHDVSFMAGRLRAAWLENMGAWYVKPYADLDITHLHLDGVRETGGNGAALAVEGEESTVVSFSPAIEIGGEFYIAAAPTIRPFVTAGITVFSDTDFALSSSFVAAPRGVVGFATVTEIDRVVADVSAGFAVLDSSGMTLNFAYDGRFGDTVREHSVGAKATFPF